MINDLIKVIKKHFTKNKGDLYTSCKFCSGFKYCKNIIDYFDLEKSEKEKGMDFYGNIAMSCEKYDGEI